MKENEIKPKKKRKSNESIVKKLTGLTLSEFLGEKYFGDRIIFDFSFLECHGIYFFAQNF